MRIVNLFSGSKGNCTFVGTAKTKILIDAGFSAKKIEKGLLEIGEDMREISAVLVTHEHDDHVHALGLLIKKYDFQVYVHEKELESKDFLALGLDKSRIRTFDSDMFEVGELQILPFKTYHDSDSSVGFCINVKGSSARLGYVTDTGKFDENMVKILGGAKIVFLESNYDDEMLQNGTYPPMLKKRIAGDFGHLSNAQSLELARRLYALGTRCFILSHISENNNLYEIAYSNYADYFSGQGIELEKDVKIRISFQRKHGNNFILNEDFNGK